RGSVEAWERQSVGVYSSTVFELLRLHVVAEQHILVADIEFAIGEDRVCPGRLLRAVGLLEAAALKVFLTARFNQQHRTGLGAVVNPAIGEGDRTFTRPAFVGVTFVPENIAGFELETNQIAAAISAVGAVEAAVVDP